MSGSIGLDENIPVEYLLATVIAMAGDLDPGATFCFWRNQMGFDRKCVVAVSCDLGAYRLKVYKDIERFWHRIIGRHEAECLESLNLRIGRWRLVIELRVLAVGDNPTVMSGELYSEGIGGELQKEKEKDSK